MCRWSFVIFFYIHVAEGRLPRGPRCLCYFLCTLFLLNEQIFAVVLVADRYNFVSCTGICIERINLTGLGGRKLDDF